MSSNLFISVSTVDDTILSTAPSVREGEENLCDICGEDHCWCGVDVPRDWQGNVLTPQQVAERAARREEKRQVKIAAQNARVERRTRMMLLRAEHNIQIAALKANPMTWIEHPYLHGRAFTLLKVMRAHHSFVHATEEQAVALLPAYALWLSTTSKGASNRWHLMNSFLNDIRQCRK